MGGTGTGTFGGNCEITLAPLQMSSPSARGGSEKA